MNDRLGALRIVVVKPGTEIANERTGETATVSDSTAVTKRGALYCTQTAYEAIKARCQQ